MVLWAHQGNIFYRTPEAYLQAGLFYWGTWGVPIFFSLSGLLITKLLLEESARTGGISLKAFYIRRCFRILPPLVIYIGIVAAAGLLESRQELASALLFYRNFLPWQQGGWYSGHLWSLSVEEHFYLFWPVLLVATGIGRGWVPGWVAGWIPALALSIICAVWRMLNLYPGNDSRTDLQLDTLLLGATMAFVLHSGKGRELLTRSITPATWATACALLIAAAATATRFAFAALIPVLMAGTITHPHWRLSRALDSPPSRALGRISYSLYLWQQLFLYPPWQPKQIGGVQRLPWSLIAAVCCAVLSYYLIERPMISQGRRSASRAGQPSHP